MNFQLDFEYCYSNIIYYLIKNKIIHIYMCVFYVNINICIFHIVLRKI